MLDWHEGLVAKDCVERAETNACKSFWKAYGQGITLLLAMAGSAKAVILAATAAEMTVAGPFISVQK